MVGGGVWPAAVTPFAEDGSVDLGGVAKLIAMFRAQGYAGIVLAGTTGEGASLSAIEKRDLVREAVRMAESFPVVLGVASNSLHEAQWLVGQAGKAGAAGVLLSPPTFYRSAGEDEIVEWMLQVVEVAGCPVLAYHFPQVMGVGISPAMLERLVAHPNVAGLKDSSGEIGNLEVFRRIVPEEKLLFVGEELVLMEALEAGWSGSISGGSNVLGGWLVEVFRQWAEGDMDGARAKFAVVEPVLREMKSVVFPGAMKGVLADWGVLESGDVRLPLANGEIEPLRSVLRERLGLR